MNDCSTGVLLFAPSSVSDVDPCAVRLSLLLLLCAAAGRAADRGPWSTVSPDAIRGHVEFLASDLLEGRAAATRGYDIAAAYVAAQFREAGLEPLGDDDGATSRACPCSKRRPFFRDRARSSCAMMRTHSFEYSTHYLPSADFTSASSTLTAPIVFAGFGVDAPELGHNDFEHVDVKGRIAVIFSGAPAKFANHQRAFYSWTQKKWTTLIERGAVGLITVDSLVDARRVPWERSVAMSWTPQMRWLDGGGPPAECLSRIEASLSLQPRRGRAPVRASARESGRRRWLLRRRGSRRASNCPA